MIQAVKQFRKETEDTLRALRSVGVRFNIITPVGHRVELFYECERLNGSHVQFVAEIDGYGNVTDWGPTYAGQGDASGTRLLFVEDVEPTPRSI